LPVDVAGGGALLQETTLADDRDADQSVELLDACHERGKEKKNPATAGKRRSTKMNLDETDRRKKEENRQANELAELGPGNCCRRITVVLGWLVACPHARGNGAPSQRLNKLH
jgi:hypothetical protein